MITVASSLGLVPCVDSTCLGLNAKFNVISAVRGLLGQALLSSPPPFIQHQIESIIAEASRGNMTAHGLKESLQGLVYHSHTKQINETKPGAED